MVEEGMAEAGGSAGDEDVLAGHDAADLELACLVVGGATGAGGRRCCWGSDLVEGGGGGGVYRRVRRHCKPNDIHM